MDNSFIDRNNRPSNLHYIGKLLWFAKKGKKRCLSLGTGAGNAELELLDMGWYVTSIDINPYSDEVMRNKMTKTQTANYEFMNTDFHNMKLTKKYDYISAINALPFEPKENMPDIINNIRTHLKKNGILSMTFFGPNTTLVKDGKAHSSTIADIKKYVRSMEIRYLEQEEQSLKYRHFSIISIICVNI